MKKSVIVSIVVILIIVILWLSGVIPKQIAKVSSYFYLKKHFPELSLKYENFEWSHAFGAYSITFKDELGELYGFCIGPKYFPIYPGQGINGFTENYQEKYHRTEFYISKMGRLPTSLSVQQAVDYGYFVYDSSSNKVYNKNVLDAFVKHTKMDAANRVRADLIMVMYNINKEPTIYELVYNQKEYILVIDNTRVYANEVDMIDRRVVTVSSDIPKDVYNITVSEDKGLNSAIISLTAYNNQYKDIVVSRYPLNAKVVNSEIVYFDPYELVVNEIL